MLAQVRKTAAIFDRAPDRTGLLQSAAREARRLTGFDRVMIYRFLRDGSGSVVAEDKAEALRHSSITATPPRTSPSKRGSSTCET